MIVELLRKKGYFKPLGVNFISKFGIDILC